MAPASEVWNTSRYVFTIDKLAEPTTVATTASKRASATRHRVGARRCFSTKRKRAAGASRFKFDSVKRRHDLIDMAAAAFVRFVIALLFGETRVAVSRGSFHLKS